MVQSNLMRSLSGPRLSLGGIRVDALERRDLVELLDPADSLGSPQLIIYHNLHTIFLYETNETFRDFYSRASWVYIDGLPVVWIGQALGLPLKAIHRITFLDCFDEILNHASQAELRVFYLGSSPEVNEMALPLLRTVHPRLIISGHHGFLAADSDNETVIAQINAFRTDILFVGMGTPLQEMWIAKHMARLNVHAILTSGGTLDYVTGHSYRPPRWAGRIGLYGVFRLLSDPKRLWRRYIVEPLLLIPFLVLRLREARRWANKAGLQ